MIEKGYAVKEIRRMIGLSFFPKEAEGQAELVKALMTARTEVVATTVINEWLDTQSERPTPADIRRMVGNHHAADEARIAQESRERPVVHRCNLCGDDGIVGGHYTGTDLTPWRWCVCTTALRRRRAEPDLVDRSNVVRDKFISGVPRMKSLG